MTKVIMLIGAFDTKGAEYAFVRERIRARGHDVLTVDFGVLETTSRFPVDVPAREVARAGGTELEVLRAKGDRGEAMGVMAAGAARIAIGLWNEGRIDGVFGMGGTGGTSVVTSAMRALPVGVPKVCLSTAAAGDTSAFVGTKDVVLYPSIVDVAGMNRISRLTFSGAVGAICGMVETVVPVVEDSRPVIAASMFGNTTECVNACAESLERAGFEVLIFHATGTGGRTMEDLVGEGLVDGVLDITTTEWADTICGGVFDAGPERMRAAGRRGIPHLIVPGCVDMANFGPPDSVPERYREGGRVLYEWNPAVTLMRTNRAENEEMGRIFSDIVNAATGPVAVLVPLRGVSILDGDGQLFCDREADAAMFDTMKAGLRPGIPFVEVDSNINDRAFSERAVAMMLELFEQSRARQAGGAGL